MYRTALKQDLRYAEAHYHAALALLKMNHLGAAEASLRRALELLPEGPERIASRVQLSDIYLAYMLRVKRDREVIKEVDRLGDEILSLEPGSFDGRRIRGTLSYLKGVELFKMFPKEAAAEFAKGIVELRAADASRPFQPEVVSVLTQALWADNRPAEAERYLRDLLRAKPTFGAAYSELARFYLKNNRPRDAEQILQSATENLPGEYQFLYQLAEIYQRSGRLADMAKTLDRLKAKAASSPLTFDLSGRLFLQGGDPGRAIQEFEEGIRRHPKNKAAYAKLIIEAYLAQKKTVEAAKLNDEILRENPNDPDALARQAEYALQNGEIDKSIASLEALLRREPGHSQAHYNLGRALIAAERRESARVHFAESIRSAPEFIPPRIALAKVELASGEYGAAVTSADDILAIDAKHAEARVLRVIGLRSLGKLDDARAELKSLLKMYPKYDDALFQAGEISAAEHKWADAEAAYRQSYEANPANIQGLLAIAYFKMDRQEIEPALDTFRAELKRRPDRLDLRLAHAALASRAGRRDEASGEYKLLLTKSGGNPKALAEVNLRLGELYFRTGDIQESRGYLEKANQLRPNNPATLHTLGVVYDALGRRKEASTLYQASLKIDGNNPVVMNNLAYYISQNGGDLDQALTFAQRARQSMPNELGFSDTVAYIYLKKNLVENAIEILEGLVGRKPNEAVYRLHLGEALLKKGELTRAKKELQVALSSKPSAEDAAKIKELLSKNGA